MTPTVFPWGLSPRNNMTPRQLIIIERARRAPARIVEMERRHGVRVGDAIAEATTEDAERESALLRAELERLVGTWDEP